MILLKTDEAAHVICLCVLKSWMTTESSLKQKRPLFDPGYLTNIKEFALYGGYIWLWSSVSQSSIRHGTAAWKNVKLSHVKYIFGNPCLYVHCLLLSIDGQCHHLIQNYHLIYPTMSTNYISIQINCNDKYGSAGNVNIQFFFCKNIQSCSTTFSFVTPMLFNTSFYGCVQALRAVKASERLSF